jgi:hypothetical protein
MYGSSKIVQVKTWIKLAIGYSVIFNTIFNTHCYILKTWMIINIEQKISHMCSEKKFEMLLKQ